MQIGSLVDVRDDFGISCIVKIRKLKDLYQVLCWDLPKCKEVVHFFSSCV